MRFCLYRHASRISRDKAATKTEDTSPPAEPTPPRHVLKQRNPGSHSLFFFLCNNSPTGAIVEVARSRTIRHTHAHTHIQPMALLWTSNQPLAQTAINTTRNKHNRQT